MGSERGSTYGDRTGCAEQEGYRNFLTSAKMSKLRLWTYLKQFPPRWALSPGRQRESRQASKHSVKCRLNLESTEGHFFKKINSQPFSGTKSARQCSLSLGAAQRLTGSLPVCHQLQPGSSLTLPLLRLKQECDGTGTATLGTLEGTKFPKKTEWGRQETAYYQLGKSYLPAKWVSVF